MVKVTFSKLLNVVLAVLLLASVFLVNATTSRSNITNTGEYDPWVDINGDGIIDIQDAAQIGLTWQAQGDPTRNVNITNWPAWWLSGSLNQSKTILVCENYTIDGTGEDVPLPFVVNTEGYGKYSVFYSYLLQPYTVQDTYLVIAPKALNIKPQHGPYWDVRLPFVGNWTDSAYCGLVVLSPEIWFYVRTANQTSLSLKIVVYLYN